MNPYVQESCNTGELVQVESKSTRNLGQLNRTDSLYDFDSPTSSRIDRIETGPETFSDHPKTKDQKPKTSDPISDLQ